MMENWKKTLLLWGTAFAGSVATCAAGQALCLQQANKKFTDTPHEDFASSQGVLAYTVSGQGQPLLLLHSMIPGTSRKEWDGVLEKLGERYRVYALDLPGFGSSFRPNTPWTAYQYAQAIHDFAEHRIQKPYFLLGANGGADLALILAKLHPEQLQGLLLVSPEGLGRGFASDKDTAEMKKLQLPLIGTHQFLAQTSVSAMKTMLEGLFFGKEKIPKTMIKEFSLSARQGEHAQMAFAALQTGFWRADTQNALEALKIPLLLMWGEENRAHPICLLEEAEKIQADGDFVIFEGTAAFPHLENSNGFADVVNDFLK